MDKSEDTEEDDLILAQLSLPFENQDTEKKANIIGVSGQNIDNNDKEAENKKIDTEGSDILLTEENFEPLPFEPNCRITSKKKWV